MSETNAAAGGTNAAIDDTKRPIDGTDPFREQIVIAEGPNPTGHADLARLAHGVAPDPAIVDDPEAPGSHTDTE